MPTWQKLTTEEVKDTIYKLAKKGLTPSQIGVILRDSHGVTQVINTFLPFKVSLHSPVVHVDDSWCSLCTLAYINISTQVKHITGTKILRILKAKGLASTIPEDLYHLIKKAVAIRKHMEKNRQVRKKIKLNLREN